MTIEARKHQIIEQITDIQDERLLKRIELLVKQYIESAQKVAHLTKPMRRNLVVEKLVKDQGYQGIKKKKLDQLIEAIHIEEPIEDLIAMV